MAGNKLTIRLYKLLIQQRNEISVYLIIFLRLLQAHLFIHITCKSIKYDKLLKLLMTKKGTFFRTNRIEQLPYFQVGSCSVRILIIIAQFL